MNETKVQEHTAEPWSVDGWNVVDAEDDNIADTVFYGRTLTERSANARRIVACVNACAGLSTEALETGVLHRFLEACEPNHEARLNYMIAVISQDEALKGGDQ